MYYKDILNPLLQERCSFCFVKVFGPRGSFFFFQSCYLGYFLWTKGHHSHYIRLHQDKLISRIRKNDSVSLSTMKITEITRFKIKKKKKTIFRVEYLNQCYFQLRNFLIIKIIILMKFIGFSDTDPYGKLCGLQERGQFGLANHISFQIQNFLRIRFTML